MKESPSKLPTPSLPHDKRKVLPYREGRTQTLQVLSLLHLDHLNRLNLSSYIGLIVPNIVALFKGDKIRGTLIDTALFGALFVLACDMIARSVIMPYEIPIELVVGIVGSIIFIIMLFYKLKHGKKAIRFKRHHGHGHHEHKKEVASVE